MKRQKFPKSRNSILASCRLKTVRGSVVSAHLSFLQVMAAGKPVVGSKVGANCDVIQHGVNGFLAATMDEWTKAIRTLRDDPSLRNQMGAEARRTVDLRALH